MANDNQERMNGNLCPDGYGCPKCGERDIDHLQIQDDEVTVSCLTCGTEYTLQEEAG